MELPAPIKAFDRYQQRRRWLAVPIAVAKKFGDDQGGSLAALMAYYAFFSLFPLLLVFVTVLGFVLHGDPSAQHSVRDSVLGRFPVIGQDVRNDHLTGHAIALVLGILTSLLAGIGVTSAAGQAFDRVWAVPFKHRPNFFQVRIQGFTLLFALGTLFLVANAATAMISGVVGGTVTAVLGVIVSLVLNFALFMAAFKLLGSTEVPWRTLVPGAIVAGVLFEVLQVLGEVYIHHFSGSANTYGVFAVVIGVLAWLHLGSQITVYAAEINVVLERKLWPRSLFGSPSTAADADTLTRLAKVEERHDQETVDVSFQPPVRTDGPRSPSPSSPPATSTDPPAPDSHRTGSGAAAPKP